MDKIELKIAARKLVEQYAASELKEGFKPAGLHAYDDEAGNLLYIRLRLKHPDGRKWIRPFYFNNTTQQWVMGEPSFTNGKPLYHLSVLAKNPAAEAWILEGEQKAETLEQLGFIATTSGSCTSASTTNWEILRGRNVVIWPDFDAAGAKYAQEVITILLSLNCKIRVVDVNKLNLHDGEDIINWLKENPHATKNDILLLPTAKKSIADKKQTISVEESEKLIIELAALSDIKYQLRRKDAANQIGIPLGALDKLVKKAKKDSCDENDELFLEIEPWHEPIDPKILLDDLIQLINRLIVFTSDHEAKAIALFILHTHCFDAADCAPILNVNSPEKRCGKSTLLSVLTKLVNRPLIASNISYAAVFRSIEKWMPTLIIDEADTFLSKNDEIKGVINSGHTANSAFVIRCIGDNHEPKRFSTWCPKIIAGIGHLPETVEDRSIIIQLRRKLNTEQKSKLRDIPESEFVVFNRKSARFAIDNIEQLKISNPKISNDLNDRAADNWTPLLAIASIASEEWLQIACEAAIQLSGNKQEPISTGIELLQDIKIIFETKKFNRVSTTDLLTELHADPEAPWITYNKGSPLAARQLATLLKAFKIYSKDMRMPPYGKNLKGYTHDDFKEAFIRYIPITPLVSDSGATTRQSSDNAEHEDLSMRDISFLSHNDNASQPTTYADCSVVADKFAHLGIKEVISDDEEITLY